MSLGAAPVQRIGLAFLLFTVFLRGPGDASFAAWAVAVVGLVIVVLAWFAARADHAQERRLADVENE